jgi:hypothetical protein
MKPPYGIVRSRSVLSSSHRRGLNDFSTAFHVTGEGTHVNSRLQQRRTAVQRRRQDDDENVDDSNKRRSWPVESAKNDDEDDDKVEEKETMARSRDADKLDAHDETHKQLRQFLSRSDEDDKSHDEHALDENLERKYRQDDVDGTHLDDDDDNDADKSYGVERRSQRADFKRHQSQDKEDNDDDRIRIVYVGDDDDVLRRRKNQKRKSRSLTEPSSAFLVDSSLVDGCRPMPCRNGARCVVNHSQSQGFSCHCQHGFTGELCQFVEFHVCLSRVQSSIAL